MKRFILIVIAVIFITVFIPLTIVMIMDKSIDNSKPFNAPETAEQVKVYIPSSDTVAEMDKSAYLAGVVAAEMPAEFECEALKAQAVAARTYLISHIRSGKDEAHKGADICTDSTHCQAFVSEEDFKANRSAELWDKVSAAVKDTHGEIVTYKGQPISAVFFSTSPGLTENAENVWGKEVPYLKSVKSKGDELAPHYTSEEIISTDDFKRIAEENIENVNWEEKLFSDISRTKSGAIKTIKIGGAEIKGTQLRTFYKLRSTNAEISVSDNSVKFAVKGYGHNVGMSQYGANYMAAHGKSYKDILKHYYTGVKIENSK